MKYKIGDRVKHNGLGLGSGEVREISSTLLSHPYWVVLDNSGCGYLFREDELSLAER